MQSQKEKIICPNCSSKNIIKKGKRKRKFREIQQFQCKNCKKFFLSETQENKTYPLKIILQAISNYNLGYTLSQVSNLIKSRYKLSVPISTISSWLNQYKDICTFARLRKQAIKFYKPNNIIHKQTLNHIQPYTFKYHKAKLYLLFHNKLYNNQFHNISQFYEPLKKYLEKISIQKFPHHIFTFNKQVGGGPNAAIAKSSLNENNNLKNIEQRASQLKFSHLKINHISKNNQANQLAKLSLNLTNSNKERHQAIQDFMLINDSTTIAIEVPIYLTNWDAGYYRNQKGFKFPLNNYKTPITGHIDILQTRNGIIHILDYKPEAKKINAIEQLTIYAMALSRKLNLPLYYFKCAWFDENNYYEFFPLHAVYILKNSKGIFGTPKIT